MIATVKKGKWYKNPEWSSPADFIKCIRFDLDEYTISGSEWIARGKYNNMDYATGDDETNHCEWHSLESCVEASYDEYAPFLPKDHPEHKRRRNINKR